MSATQTDRTNTKPVTPPLNPICTACKARGVTCDGTTCQTWTGCIYRKI